MSDVVDSCPFWTIHSLQCVHLMQVILSDGDLSTLSNMKLNLKLNQLSAETYVLERFGEDPNTVSSSFSSFIFVTTFLSRQLISLKSCAYFMFILFIVFLFNVNMPNSIIKRQWNNY